MVCCALCFLKSSSLLKLSNHFLFNGFVGDSAERRNKGGRGVLKGLSAATKRIRSGSQKLKVEFSTKLGGPVGPNNRSFVDEVVMFTRKRAPLIGVKKWKDIEQNVKNSIASDILVHSSLNLLPDCYINLK